MHCLIYLKTAQKFRAVSHIPKHKPNSSPSIGSVTNVTRLAVQGENGTENYVTSYEVDYSEDGIVYTNIKNGLKPQVGSLSHINQLCSRLFHRINV